MTKLEYQPRRQALLEKMVPASAAIIFSAPPAKRNTDAEYPYRQNSNFLYLTGFNEPEAALILLKPAEKPTRSILFNRARDLTAEIWSGRRLGHLAAPKALGVDEAHPFDDMDEKLPSLLGGLDVLYHAQGEYPAADQQVSAALEKLRKGLRENPENPPAPKTLTLTDWRPLLYEMRLFKSAEEIEVMRQAGKISAAAHTRAMKKCRPDMFEYELEAEIHHEFTRHGARFPAYNTIIGGGENGCILHYTENSATLRDGDLVLVDAGCEYQGYASDITRTFPVNGKFTPAQRDIYDIVLGSLNTALKLFKPGTCIRNVHEQVVRIMITGLQRLGVIEGDVDQLYAKQAHRQFFMHGLSHWLGLDVHDVSDYRAVERGRPLESGMVLTVEPGLYIAPNAEVPDKYRGIGIRIEDDILITENGNENLTASVVKEVDDIEKLMASGTPR